MVGVCGEEADLRAPIFPFFVEAIDGSQTCVIGPLGAEANRWIYGWGSHGGESWDTLATDWPATAYDVDTATLRATTQGRIRIIASDGFRGGRAESPGYFTVLNHSPSVAIVRPQSGDVFIANQQVIFHGNASDVEDGALEGPSVEWHSSLDGRLGTGAELFSRASALSAGDHIITAIASDSAGATNGATVTLRVQRQESSVLSIRTAELQAILSWPTSLTNYVLEFSPPLPAPQWSAMTNVPVVTDVDQSVTVDASLRTRFFRLRLQ
jgi:hypothetical protein